MITRYSTILVTLCLMTAAEGLVASAAAQQSPASAAGSWVVPRTPDGHPDLQGNWTNVTITPFERPEDQESPVLTLEEVQERQGDAVDLIVRRAQPSDPDRPAPPPGEVSRCRPSREFPTGSPSTTTGCGYNYVYFERGLSVALVNGEPRSSLITFPSNGRIPELTPEGQRRRQERQDFRSQFAQYDHPELRPLAERCLTSFGSPAGPPMLPNGGYNSNYIIVQTADHVMIMTEMVHDARIIRIGDGPRLPPHIRPWMGDSWGHWEGDVLVVETTNIHPLQPYSSADMRVMERFSRMSEDAILYEFTVNDPSTYTESWGGQIPMMAMPDQIYEYACHEGNYGMTGVLSGARYQERMEAQGSSDSRRD